MKKLILISNNLPGSGKSTLAEVLLAKLSNNGFNTALLATTVSDDAEDRLSASPTAITWDFEEDSDMSNLIDFIDRNDAVIIDVGTGDIADLQEFAERNQMFDCLAELDVELTIAIPLHGDQQQADSIVEIAETFSDNADYIVTRSAKAADDGWAGSYAQKVMSYLNAAEIASPSANGSLAKALEEHELELHQAVSARNDLPRGLKTAITKWERQFGDKIEAEARDFIVPDHEEHRDEELSDLESSAIAC